MNFAPFVSIIIPTYRDWERLALCISALDKQTYSKDLFEVIIVNNDAQDQAPSNYYLPKNFTILTEAKAGSYAARNTGLKVAKGEIIGFTDADCIPLPDWIENAIALLSTGTVDRIGGHIDLFYEDDNHKTWVELHESIYGFDQKNAVEVLRGSVTANLFVKRELFDKVGGFDENKKSGEDIGWNRRANSFGYNLIYAKNVRIKHPARSSFEAFKNKKLREFGGIKKFKTDALSILKNIIYLPFLFYMTVVRRTILLFLKAKQLTLPEKIKVSLVNTYLFIIYTFEFFRLMFGGERIR